MMMTPIDFIWIIDGVLFLFVAVYSLGIILVTAVRQHKTSRQVLELDYLQGRLQVAFKTEGIHFGRDLANDPLEIVNDVLFRGTHGDLIRNLKKITVGLGAFAIKPASGHAELRDRVKHAADLFGHHKRR